MLTLRFFDYDRRGGKWNYSHKLMCMDMNDVFIRLINDVRNW